MSVKKAHLRVSSEDKEQNDDAEKEFLVQQIVMRNQCKPSQIVVSAASAIQANVMCNSADAFDTNTFSRLLKL